MDVIAAAKTALIVETGEVKERERKNIEQNYIIQHKHLTHDEVVLKCKRDLYNLINSNNLIYTYNLLESILNSNNKEYLCHSLWGS